VYKTTQKNTYEFHLHSTDKFTDWLALAVRANIIQLTINLFNVQLTKS